MRLAHSTSYIIHTLVHTATAIAAAWIHLSVVDAFCILHCRLMYIFLRSFSFHFCSFILSKYAVVCTKKERKKPFVYIINDSDWEKCWHKRLVASFTLCLSPSMPTAFHNREMLNRAKISPNPYYLKLYTNLILLLLKR